MQTSGLLPLWVWRDRFRPYLCLIVLSIKFISVSDPPCPASTLVVTKKKRKKTSGILESAKRAEQVLVNMLERKRNYTVVSHQTWSERFKSTAQRSLCVSLRVCLWGGVCEGVISEENSFTKWTKWWCRILINTCTGSKLPPDLRCSCFKCCVMNEGKTKVESLKCWEMDRRHYKSISSGHWGLTPGVGQGKMWWCCVWVPLCWQSYTYGNKYT